MTEGPNDRSILLLQNLLDRLDADAKTDRPQNRGVVSDAEREALRALLGGVSGSTSAPQPPTDGPVAAPEGHVATPSPPVELKLDALQLSASPKPEWVLCLDFGTAKSKAFAATQHEEDPDFKPLPIGLADKDRDGAVHEVASCVWIDEGLLFVGSEAVERGMKYGGDREPLDSLKQQISLVNSDDGATEPERILPKKVDPSSTLSYGDAITAYFAYLTDLATTELETDERVATRYVRRRFTVPAWRETQRGWAADWIGTRLLRGQLLADTFHGRWRGGIPVQEVKDAVQAAAKHDDRLAWMAATESADSSDWSEGTLESLAAASSRLWTDDSARNLMLVVDVGAGTTDLSLFWVVQEQGKFHRAWPVVGGIAEGIRQAGNQLDDCLVEELMGKAGLGIDGTGKLAREALRREGVRRLKETLFLTGRVTTPLVNDETVSLTREEFMETERVRRFSRAIEGKVQELLDGVHESWQGAAESGFTVVLTGGGCDLPMIKELAEREWRLGREMVRVRKAPREPEGVVARFNQEFVQEYPRLAVAMGGALKMRLDEKNPLREWMGGTGPPGGLEQFPTKGI